MAVNTTTIQGNLLTPTGAVVREATIFVKLSHPGSNAADGSLQQMLAESAIFSVSDGVLLDEAGNPAALVPNDDITPGGTWYTWIIKATKPSRETWKITRTVPTTPDPVDIGDLGQPDSGDLTTWGGLIKVDVLPTASAAYLGKLRYLTTDAGGYVAGAHVCLEDPDDPGVTFEWIAFGVFQ